MPAKKSLWVGFIFLFFSPLPPFLPFFFSFLPSCLLSFLPSMSALLGVSVRPGSQRCNLASSPGTSSPGQESLPQMQRRGRTAVRRAERLSVSARPLGIAVQGAECVSPQSLRRDHLRQLSAEPSHPARSARLPPACS